MTTTEITAAAGGHWDLGGDLRIARVGFGAMRLPGRSWQGPAVDRADALAVLHRTRELGINHIDTAAFYFFGEQRANELISSALRPYADDLVIATKVGPQRGADGNWAGEAGPGELRAAVERNLRELGVDRLDLVYLRAGGMGVAEGSIAARFEALAQLREEGLIRHLGVSNVGAGQLAEAAAIAPVVALQNYFNIVTRQHAELVDVCAEQGIAYVPFFPVGGHGLPEDATVVRVAKRLGVTVAQLSLAWLLHRAPNVLLIPGTSSVAHLEENVAAGAVSLSAADLAELDTIR